MTSTRLLNDFITRDTRLCSPEFAELFRLADRLLALETPLETDAEANGSILDESLRSSMSVASGWLEALNAIANQIETNADSSVQIVTNLLHVLCRQFQQHSPVLERNNAALLRAAGIAATPIQKFGVGSFKSAVAFAEFLTWTFISSALKAIDAVEFLTVGLGSSEFQLPTLAAEMVTGNWATIRQKVSPVLDEVRGGSRVQELRELIAVDCACVNDGDDSVPHSKSVAISRQDTSNQREVPQWSRDDRTLKFKGMEVRKFAPQTKDNVLMILSAFEECCWSVRIDDPLSPQDGEKTKLALRTINENLVGLRFSKDGDGIRWEVTLK